MSPQYVGAQRPVITVFARWGSMDSAFHVGLEFMFWRRETPASESPNRGLQRVMDPKLVRHMSLE